ncbi:HD domain-containing protein [Candidatus Woesearchaeota archaeon]|nr:HD domain-containing protein [Candidatus Woesearchaeota archaeon]
MKNTANEGLNCLARDYFIEQWGDERIKVHCECVIDVCLALSQRTDLKMDVFIIAGWLHDLGRKTDKDKHHELGLKYLDEFLACHPEYALLKDEIADCILNHRTHTEPKTLYGIAFRAADKLSLRHMNWIEYKRSLEKE